MLKAIRDHYLRLDARSLGLFRAAFGLVLLGDLFARWRWLTAFYSNDGVLPNHNHLFNFRDNIQFWSFLHAFTTPLENHFAFGLILLVYIAFTLGWHTRVFHALSLVCLVSLAGRNLLTEGAGDYAAIALLAFTLFLPCGSWLSIDSLRASMRLVEEKSDRDLNRRTKLPEAVVNGLGLPGSSPVGLAALAVLIQLAVLFVCLAYQHDGAPWKDGSALYYGLHTERFTSGIGVALRDLSPGLLKAYTYALRAAEWAIPLLLFVPIARGKTRGLAAGMMAFYGLSFGLLFSFGLFGWSIAAASLLVISGETWDALEKSWSPKRARTVIYDEDCGVCLLLARFAKRLDMRGHLTFQGNGDIEKLLEPSAPGEKKRIKRPEGLTAELVASTIVVVDREGTIYTRSRAVSEVIQALPLGLLKAWILRVPGLSNAADALYDKVAESRHRISEEIGLGACGIQRPVEGGAGEAEGLSEVSPARRARNLITAAIRDFGALALLLAMFAQTAKENRVPGFFPKVPQGRALAAIAVWPRMIARWDILTPAPETEDSAYVIDAQTKGGQSLDPLTGREPAFEPSARRGAQLGSIWNNYLDRIRNKEWAPFQRAFRDYLAKGGAAWRPEPPENQIVGFDAYWVTTPIAPPGGPPPTEPQGREKLFTHSRGGKYTVERVPTMLRTPDPPKQP